MRIIANAGDVIKKAWSIRLMIVAAILSGIEVALPIFGDTVSDYVHVPDGLFGALSGIVTGAAFVARLLAQTNLPDPAPSKPAEGESE